VQAAGCVDVHIGEPEQALDRPLNHPDALQPGQLGDHEPHREPPVPGAHHHVGMAERAASTGQRRDPPGPLGHRVQRHRVDVDAVQHARDDRTGGRPVGDRQQDAAAHPLLRRVAAVPGDVELGAHPTQRPPQQRAGDLHGLYPQRGDGLVARLEQAVPQAQPGGVDGDAEVPLGEDPP